MSSELTPSPALIFQASLCHQSVPDDGHKANVTPIYKAGKEIRVKLKITDLYLLHKSLAKS